MFKKTTSPKDYGIKKEAVPALPNNHTDGVLVVLSITGNCTFFKANVQADN